MTTPLHRAYSVLHVKDISIDGDVVRIKGIASTPTTDRMGDIVEPMGAKFALPMKLLWQHRHAEPVGNVTFAQPTAKGIPFEAELPVIQEAGRLKDRVDEAIHSLKYNLVSAVSIGFQAIEGAVERMKSGGLRFKEWEWLELSLVTIPANHEAVITAVKQLDQEHLPASGQEVREVEPPASRETAPRGQVRLRKSGRKPIKFSRGNK